MEAFAKQLTSFKTVRHFTQYKHTYSKKKGMTIFAPFKKKISQFFWTLLFF